jgi:hypothetical protein
MSEPDFKALCAAKRELDLALFRFAENTPDADCQPAFAATQALHAFLLTHESTWPDTYRTGYLQES